jgi:hypothetical protein
MRLAGTHKRRGVSPEGVRRSGPPCLASPTGTRRGAVENSTAGCQHCGLEGGAGHSRATSQDTGTTTCPGNPKPQSWRRSASGRACTIKVRIPRRHSRHPNQGHHSPT